jgi:hypothetical protein
MNPASLAAAEAKNLSAWHLNAGNISESLRLQPEENLTIKSQGGSLGWATGWGNFGLGILASIKTTRSQYSVEGDVGNIETASTRSRFGSVAMRGGLRLNKAVAIGLSYARYGMTHDFSIDENRAGLDLPTLESSFYGNAPTIGLTFGDSKSMLIGLVHRPQFELSQTNDNIRTGGNSQRIDGGSIRSARQAYQHVSSNGFQSARMVMPAKTTLGVESVLWGKRDLVFRSDLSLLNPVAGAYLMEPGYLVYLSRESDLAVSARRYQILPGIGMAAKLHPLLFFDEVAGGVYFDENAGNRLIGDRHWTYGISKSYQLWGMDLSVDFAVDQTETSRRYVVNLF